MAKTNYLRTLTALTAIAAAALVAVAFVAYSGAASAQGGNPNNPPVDPPDGDPGTPDPNPPSDGGGNNPPPGGAPTVISTNPSDGATNVDRDKNVKAKFSEKMKKSSINTNTVLLFEGNLTDDDINPPPSGNPNEPDPNPPSVDASVSYNKKKKKAVLNPSQPLQAGTTYTLVVEGEGDTDGQAVEDKGGTPMATDKIVQFTT